MARSGDWQLAEMAKGDPKPAWPLQGPRTFSLTSFGGGRPFGCTYPPKNAKGDCERWHAGVDLTNAKDGTVVLAPEDGTIVAVDVGWSSGSKAVFLQTDTGLFVVLGGTKLGSGKPFGIAKGVKVKKGAPVGRVLGSYGMVHLETYANPDATRTKNTPWPIGQLPPSGLLNPTWYVQDMLDQPHAFLTDRQKLEALKALGWYAGATTSPWGDEATEALKAAQKAYGLTADGKWGSKTEAAIRQALLGKMPKPEPKPGEFLPPTPKPSGGESVWPWVIGGLAVAGIAAGIAVSASGGRK